MPGCGHCGGCCAHCGAVCGGCGGRSAAGIAGAFYGGIGPFGMRSEGYGELMFTPYVGGVPFFHHKKRRDDDTTDATPEGTKVNCDALADPNHPEHREAVATVAHVDDAAHESFMKRLGEELGKL